MTDPTRPAASPPIVNTQRRRLLQSVGAGAALGTSLLAGGASADAAAAVPRGAVSQATLGATHDMAQLPFDPARLRGLSQRLITSHWSNNYGGSVRALNTVNARLADALAQPDLPGFIYNDLKREHLMRTGSVVLHELYFENLGGSGRVDAPMRARLGAAFGSFDVWETEFRRIATGLGGGSGWVMLAWNTHLGLLENYWMADHLHAPSTAVPLLVLDMYEHSYHMDYGAAAARYVDAFFDNINWEVVAQRLG